MLAIPDTADHPLPPHHHRSQSMIQFSHAEKFFSKLRSRDSLSSSINTRNPSFRVYYNESIGSVPFEWETVPGTPKRDLFEYHDAYCHVVTPLTPPPCFFKVGTGREESERSRGSRNVIGGFEMRRIKSVKTRISHSSSSSCESASSKTSGDVDRKAPFRTWRSLSAVRFSMRFGKGEELKLNSEPTGSGKAASFVGCFRS